MPTSDSSPPYSQDLLHWYRTHRRDLPWRRTSDPYSIWVSEVMLQQTQVSTVIPYYERWLRDYPTVGELAVAAEQDVLARWAGLGYYRRCRLLHQGARYVVQVGMPTTLEGWREVPGIGKYTAAAIASIAQRLPVPLVDGNVERVFARVKGKGTTGKELLDGAWKWAEEVLYHADPGSWNQALMELGATVCRPTKPLCPACPIKGHCYAFQTGSQERLPAPTIKPAVIRLLHTCWIPFWNGLFGLRQIPQGEWWEGMWEFPRAAHNKGEDPVSPYPYFTDAWGEELGSIQHAVTNHRISLRIILVRSQVPIDGLRWEDPSAVLGLPLPAPQRRAFRLALRQLGMD